MSEIIKLDIRTTTVPVVLIGTDGKPQDYELCEMTGAERDKYLDELGHRMSRDKDGKPTGITNYQGLQASLISRCLYRRGEKAPVALNIIQAWPATAVTALFEASQKLNHIGEAEKQLSDDSKKDSRVSGEIGSK